MATTSADEIMATLTQLQEMEQALHQQVVDNPNLSTQEYTKLVKSINDLSDVRVKLYGALSALYGSTQGAVNSSRTDLVSQYTMANIVNTELKDAKARLDELKSLKNNKMRMVEINTYFGKRYQATSALMKLIIFISVPLLFLAILKKTGVIPDGISNVLMGITLALGAVLLARQTWDYWTRSNMNFDEYDWKFQSPDKISPTIWEYNSKNFLPIELGLKNVVTAIGLDCYGEQCCAANMTYDQTNRVCKTDESFVSGELNLCNDKSGILPYDGIEASYYAEPTHTCSLLRCPSSKKN